MSEYRTAQQHMDAFRDAMAAAGLGMAAKDSLVDDGKLHRYDVDGDRRGRRNGWYVFHDDGTPAGAFGTWKGAQHTWRADRETVKPLTRDERDELARKRDERKAREAAEKAALEAHAAKRARAMWDAAAPAEAHPYLTRKGIEAHGVRVGEFWKERREDGKPYLAAKNALLIAVKDSTREIVSLQAVYATPIKVGEELRDKDFVYGGKKEGCWATIGAPCEIGGVLTIGICEGFATGGSAHEATGMGVVVAFDSGNLLKVAREVRRLLPDARLVILADNDRWTDRPVVNPGLTKGRDTAQAVGGILVAPEFDDLTTHPTDWNDLHALEGVGEVRRQIMAVLGVPEREQAVPEREQEEPPQAEAEDYGAPIEAEPDLPAPAPAITPPDAPEEDEDDLAENPFFKVCGQDHTYIYVYQRRKKMIYRRGIADWPEGALTAIAPLHWWELNFPGEKGLNKKMALNWLQRRSEDLPVFEHESLRGRGAWIDDGRYVFHFGDRIWVDGTILDLAKVDSTFIYEQGRRLRLPAEAPMTASEGKALFEAFQHFGWTRPASAVLLAGWVALASVGGALRWRPHTWITGGAGSGKSTILNLVHWLLNGVDIYAQGNSTEAGIRQTIRADSRPVLFDESEQNNEREVARIQAVLSLMRQSSTESDAQTLKGTQGGEAMHFVIKSMFCLGSIQVGLKQQADMERVSILSLKPKKAGEAEDVQASATWKRISGAMATLKADADLPSKLLHRSLKLLPLTVQNVEVFAQAASEKFGSQRDGDQYGTLLAGAWSLVSTKLATLDEARAMIDRYDWSDYLEGSETEESDKALAALMGRLVRGKNNDVSLYELVARAANVDCGYKELSQDAAANLIQRYGLKVCWGETRYVDDAHLLVATKHGELDRLMEATPYAADLKGQLLRVAGADRHPIPVRFLGVQSRAIRLPLPMVLGGADTSAAGSAPAGGDDWDDIPF